MNKNMWEVNEDYKCPECGAVCEVEYEDSGNENYDGNPIYHSTGRERCTKCSWTFEYQ